MIANEKAPGRDGTGPEAERLEQGQTAVSNDRLQVANLDVYDHAEAPKAKATTTLYDLIDSIRSNEFAERVLAVRQAGAEGDDDRVATLKKQLPAVSISGSCDGRRKAAVAEGRFTHSGLIQIDVDGKDNPGLALAEIRNVLIADPRVVAAFISPGGNGVKGVARIPADPALHRQSFFAVEAHFASLGIKIDGACKDPVRLMFVSHDPGAFLDESRTGTFEPLAEPAPAPTPPKPTTALSGGKDGIVLREGGGTYEVTLDDLREMIAVIPRPPYLQWLEICSGAWSEFGEDATPILMERWPEEEVGEYARKFADRLDRAISFGTVFHHATEAGWKPPGSSSSKSPAKAVKVEGETKDKAVAICTRILQRLERGIAPSDDDLENLTAAVNGTESPEEMLSRAYAMRFDPAQVPPPDELCLMLGDDHPIAARGNLTVIQGKSKVGKSAVVSAILGAAQRGLYYAEADTLCIRWVGDDTGAILHVDTEQSMADWHTLVMRGITRSGMPSVSPRLVSLPLVPFTRTQRLSILRRAMQREMEAQGRIDVVLIDGFADLCRSPNDEAEALELVATLHGLAMTYNCAIIGNLHENPSAMDAKTRGHLGSELNRKAFANLRLDKDAETSVTTMFGTDMRKRDLPREQGFCFAWDDSAGMHAFQGRAAGVKAAKREAKEVETAMTLWGPIFDRKRDKSSCPVLSVEEALELQRDISGTKEKMSSDAMKKRLQRAEVLGIVSKNGRGEWRISEWDKRDKNGT